MSLVHPFESQPLRMPFFDDAAAIMTASYFSSPFPLPAQRIVGLLSCQVDPLARSLQTRVLRCDKAAAADEPAKQTNQSKKAAKNSKKDEDEWEIELEDTVL